METKLFYTSPASEWCLGFPIGNGRMGAMIHGSATKEYYSLNEETLWSGLPYQTSRDDSHVYFEKAKALVNEGKRAEARVLLEENFGDKVTQMYLPLGDLVISSQGGDVTDYTRTLDLARSVATVSYRQNGILYTRESFVSHPDDVMVIRITADRPSSVSFSATVAGKLRPTVAFDGNDLVLTGNCPVYRFDRGEENKYIENYEYGETDEKKGVGYAARLRVLAVGGTVTKEDGVFTVANADEALLFVSVKTSFNGYSKHPVLEGVPYLAPCKDTLDAAAKKDYATLLSRHENDVMALFSRVSLRLPNDNGEAVPTDIRLLGHAQGKRDRGLYELLYHFARYLTIASSREGTQPTNLQGIWNDLMLPAWGCNLTININTEMNYWPTLSAGLTECYEPLVRLVSELSESGRHVARTYYGADGFVSHSATDIWRIAYPHNNGIKGSLMWGFFNMSSGWLATMLYDYYRYTMDTEYLRKVFPIMLSAAEFYRSLLTEYEGDLVVFPATSPENNYYEKDGSLGALDVTSEMAMAITRHLFSAVAEAGEALSDSRADEYEKLLPRLRKVSVAPDGRIREWVKDYKEWDPHHRHVSHLYGLYPGRDISENTPELLSAARKVLNVRGDESTGWSTAWKVNFWARLFDGDRAEQLLDMQLRPVVPTNDINYADKGGSFLSLLCAHPPFQIDGNFGGAAGITEMLVRPNGSSVALLPALPSDWDHGEVDGIRIHGGGKISFAWENGRVTRCSIAGGAYDYKVTQNGAAVDYERK